MGNLAWNRNRNERDSPVRVMKNPRFYSSVEELHDRKKICANFRV